MQAALSWHIWSPPTYRKTCP